MVAINVLDKNLVRIGIIPHYTSLIWASRYVQNGDCELYLPATMEYIDMLQSHNQTVGLSIDYLHTFGTHFLANRWVIASSWKAMF